MGFTITTVNPLDHADEIKRLFVACGRAEFPGFFDRAYEPAVRAGGVSWLGRDAAGRAGMRPPLVGGPRDSAAPRRSAPAATGARGPRPDVVARRRAFGDGVRGAVGRFAAPATALWERVVRGTAGRVPRSPRHVVHVLPERRGECADGGAARA